MRIRKVSGRISQPRASAPVRATARNLAEVGIEAAPVDGGEFVPGPSAISASHPESKQSTFGLHEYSTGMLSLPTSLKEKTGLAQIALKVYSQRQLDKNMILSALRSAVITFPPTRDVKVMGPNGERFVASAHLNPDGTERNDSTHSADLSPRKTFAPGISFREIPQHIAANAVSYSRLCGTGQDIGNTAAMQWPISIDLPGLRRVGNVPYRFTYRDLQHNSSPTPDALLLEFDRLAANVNMPGLVRFAAAAKLLEEQFPGAIVSLFSEALELKNVLRPMGVRSGIHSRLHVNVARNHSSITLTLPQTHGFRVNIQSSNGSLRYAVSLRVWLSGRHVQPHGPNNVPVPEGLADIGVTEEVGILVQMTSAIVDGLCKGLKFDSFQAVAPLLAEGLLQAVRFPNPNLILERVRAQTVFSDNSKSGFLTVHADKWLLEEPRNHASVQGAETASTSNASEVDISSAGTQLTPTEPTDSTPERKRVSKQISQDVHLAFIFLTSKYPLLKEKLGSFQIRLHAQWPNPESRLAAGVTVTAKDVESRLAQALRDCSPVDLRSVWKSFATVGKDLPGDPEVKMTLHEPRTGQTPKPSHSDKPLVTFFAFPTASKPYEVKVRLKSARIQHNADPHWPRGTLSVVASIYGSFPNTSKIHGVTNFASQLESMKSIASSLTDALVRRTAFSKMRTLASRVLATISGRIDWMDDDPEERIVYVEAQLEAGKTVQKGRVSSRTPSLIRRDGFVSDEDDANNHRAFISLGSNVGARLQNIEAACRAMDSGQEIRVIRTSALYETEPMYVQDQDRFLNGVCEIITSLDPMQLLDRLQSIEQQLGRVKTIDKGPRNIDLDILLYANEQIQTERLTIPHALMLEREFVLRPLCDLLGVRMRTYPGRGALTYSERLRMLPPSAETMIALTSLVPNGRNLCINDPHRQTHMMSIVNVTPDSFSDGGQNDPADQDHFVSLIKSQIAAGATIIDIGGQSSRPNAPDVTAEEEIARVLPAIEAIKALPEAAAVAISVDTYRAAVAEAAIEAGAHIINDISAGQLDPEMFPTIARLGCTYIMMHMRGTPATMMSEENCSYPKGLINTIAHELRNRLNAAEDAGIRRWRIILDPGIGFSKTADQNAELLRDFAHLRTHFRLPNFGWLLGSSRKSFIGKITGVEDPKARGLGTAATVTAAIQGGADIVRIHDAGEMAAAVRMADAMYRK